MRRSNVLRCLLVSSVFLCLGSGAEASRLIATSGPRALFEIDPTTGASHLIADLPAGRSWRDIAARPGDTGGVYNAARLLTGSFDNATNVISRIDLTSGVATDLYELVASDIGLPARAFFEITGIAISSTNPSVATLAALRFTDSPLPGDSFTRFLFDLDLDTGATSPIQEMLGPQSAWGTLTFAADETPYSVLAGTPRPLGRIDRATSTIIEIPRCSSCPTVGAIEFDPISGELFGVDFNGNLIRLSPTDASTLQTIGQTGRGPR